MFCQSQGIFVAFLYFSVRNPQAGSASHPVKPALMQTKSSEISCRHCRTKTGKNKAQLVWIGCPELDDTQGRQLFLLKKFKIFKEVFDQTKKLFPLQSPTN